MPALPLRTDFDANSCRLVVRHAGDAAQTLRPLSIAAIYDGASRINADWYYLSCGMKSR